MLEIKNLCFSYGDKQVLKDFSATLPLSGIIGFTGPSGCGKTTLLRVLAGLEIPTCGSVEGLDPRNTAFLFQENRLLPWRTVKQHITDVLPRERWDEAEDWLALAELEGEGESMPADLSGGMARRLAVVRCAALGGAALLMDEPFTGVDAERAQRMMTKLRGLGMPILLVSHEQPVLDLCDQVYEFTGLPLKML